MIQIAFAWPCPNNRGYPTRSLGDPLRSVRRVGRGASSSRGHRQLGQCRGAYSTAGNWSLNATSGSSDLADFPLNDSYTVNFSANAIASQLLVDSGQVTFNLGEHTADFTSFSNVPTYEGISVAQSANSTARTSRRPSQIFRLLDANSGITGSLTLSGPDASGFTIKQGRDTLDVVYNGSSVPEPAGIAIFSVAGILLLRRKRTRFNHPRAAECAARPYLGRQLLMVGRTP